MFIQYLINFDWKYNVLKIFFNIFLFPFENLDFEFFFENFNIYKNNLINIKVAKVL
jgi:hypothetical protein